MAIGTVPVGQKPLDFDQEDSAIREVNAHYNKVITYKTQQGNGGSGSGGWQMNDLPDGGEGDCDTFARSKGEALIRAGVPPEKLSIVVAKLWNGVDHALLQVDRGNGKYMYLSNPQNKLQAQNPDASIMDELPGKQRITLDHPMWGLMHDMYKQKQDPSKN